MPAPERGVTRLPELLELVVIDLDGTACLLDVPWRDVESELEALARGHGLPSGDRRSALTLIHEARAHDPRAASILERRLASLELDGAAGCRVNLDLLAWLDGLPRSVPVAVLSLNARAAVRLAVERAGLSWRVSAVVAREDVERYKPDPEGLELLLDGHGAAPERTVMVGDSVGDCLCAAAARTCFIPVSAIGVAWGAPRVALAA